MSNPKAMMWYCEAWLSSPRVTAMHPTARAGYFDLMCNIWLAGGYLDDDDSILWACSRLSPADWRKHRDQIRACLDFENGKVTQKRLLEEHERTLKLRDRRSKGGAEGARRRWSKDGSPNRSPNSPPIGSPNSSPKILPLGVPMQTETESRGRESATHSLTPTRGETKPDPAFRRFLDECQKLCPERVKIPQLAAAWHEIVTTPEIEDKVFAGFAAWKLGKDWQVGRFNRFDRWLLDLRFDSPPEPYRKKETAATSGYSSAERADPKYGYGRQK